MPPTTRGRGAARPTSVHSLVQGSIVCRLGSIVCGPNGTEGAVEGDSFIDLLLVVDCLVRGEQRPAHPIRREGAGTTQKDRTTTKEGDRGPVRGCA